MDAKFLSSVKSDFSKSERIVEVSSALNSLPLGWSYSSELGLSGGRPRGASFRAGKSRGGRPLVVGSLSASTCVLMECFKRGISRRGASKSCAYLHRDYMCHGC